MKNFLENSILSLCLNIIPILGYFFIAIATSEFYAEKRIYFCIILSVSFITLFIYLFISLLKNKCIKSHKTLETILFFSIVILYGILTYFAIMDIKDALTKANIESSLLNCMLKIIVFIYVTIIPTFNIAKEFYLIRIRKKH